jgi:ribosomal protein S4
LDLKNKFARFLKRRFLFQLERKLRFKQEFTFDHVLIFRRIDKKRLKKRFASIRIVRLYYVTLKYKHFRILAKLASQQDGFFQRNFCYHLECRLISVIYRSQVVHNIFSSIYFVKKGTILINRILVRLPNAKIAIGDFIILLLHKYSFFKENIIKRLKTRGIFFSNPRYMFVSYKMGLISVLRYPQERDLAFPIKFNIYRASGYY